MTRKKRKKGKGCLTVLLCILAAALCVTGFIALRTQLVYKKLTKPAVTEAAIRPSVDFVQPVSGASASTSSPRVRGDFSHSGFMSFHSLSDKV